MESREHSSIAKTSQNEDDSVDMTNFNGSDGAASGELGALGVEVYDQEQFEAKVMQKVDEVLEKQEKQRMIDIRIRELSNIVDQLKNVLAKHEKSEKALAAILDGGSGGTNRKALSRMEDVEAFRKQKRELLNKQKELVCELKEFGKDVTHDPNIKLIEWDKAGDEKDVTNVLVESMAKENETEKEKAIRLGEMTAFGKTLKSETDQNEEANFKQYVSDQLSAGKDDSSQKSDRGNLIQQCVKARQRECTKKELEKRESEESSWESSEDEEDDLSLINLSSKKKNHRLDDGNRDDFLRRLHQWQKREGATTLDSKSECLEGGLHVPSRIWEKLYNYQKVCVQWLWELHQQKVGGILGDEMGLGKTIQIIAFLSSMSFSQRRIGSGKRFGPVLIVCPTTVMHQWVREFHTWWPPFRVAVLHESGSHKGDRIQLIRSIASSSGVLVTSYNAVVAHQECLHKEDFQYIILDEGHKIRNPDAQVTLAVKMFPTPHRLILSGSPLQNNLKELWSLFDFIYPGKLGTLPVFMQQFSVPITQGGYSNASRVQVATAYKCATVLRDTINPYLLRRMKSDVKQHIHLPEKNEQVLFCNLTEEQREVYKNYIDSGEIKGILDGRIQIFVGLINLRKICNHPDLFCGPPKAEGTPLDPLVERYGYWKRSGKMIVIQALLKLWKKQGHRVLLFTQSRQMLEILEDFVIDQEYSYLKMDGTTSIGSRQPLIDRFNKDEGLFLFLLTTKVGGLGVNLTGASRVVIFDPDWNPSTDTQARERAWRIGQNKQVTIYRLMTAGTIEEKIYHRQIFKQFLVNRILKDPKQKRFFKSNDLYELFTLSEGTTDRTETSAIFAGTGSEVKVKKSKRKREPTGRDEEGFSEKRQKNREAVPVASFKPDSRRKPTEATTNVRATLAKLYSQEQEGTSSCHMTEREKLMAKVKAISQKIATGQLEKGENEKKDKKTKFKRGKFEGHKISHLVKTRPFKQPAERESSNKEVSETSESQDNYVLSKLFKKTGVHSAVRHDVIIDGGDDDYVLIEGEAEKVAKEAVESLKRSRRECFRAEAGVPTWTGSNGVVARRNRFGNKKKKSATATVSSTSAIGLGEDYDSSFSFFSKPDSLRKDKQTAIVGNKKHLSSSDLLERMKRRNRFSSLITSNDDNNSGDNLFAPDTSTISNTEMDLLADIRNFIAFQAAVDGQATSTELVTRFSTRVPPRSSPLFKALLNQICIFDKSPIATLGEGIWKLKHEFC